MLHKDDCSDAQRSPRDERSLRVSAAVARSPLGRRSQGRGHTPLTFGLFEQTSIDQCQSPARKVRKRRDPRTTYLGFTSRQWPFLFVLVGNWVFSLTFFLGVKLVWHWAPSEWATAGDRIALVFKCAALSETHRQQHRQAARLAR
jgi:hypothetical protein